MLILAGVGTGKTETLMRKYAYLLSKGINPSRIMCVTFTNKAAKEMKKRAASILESDLDYFDKAFINTFHSLSYRILKTDKNYLHVGLKEDFHILDKED